MPSRKPGAWHLETLPDLSSVTGVHREKPNPETLMLSGHQTALRIELVTSGAGSTTSCSKPSPLWATSHPQSLPPAPPQSLWPGETPTESTCPSTHRWSSADPKQTCANPPQERASVLSIAFYSDRSDFLCSRGRAINKCGACYLPALYILVALPVQEC